MALKVDNLEGNELADDYIRKSVPQGRWADAWDVFKSNFLKFVLLNLVVFVTFVPGIAVMFIRSNYYLASLGLTGPFNPSLGYPFNPDTVGLSESITLSADILFYSLLIAAGFIASIGISGAAYSIKKILNTHGECTVKGFFHGIKVCYFTTVLPVTLFMTFFFCTTIVGDWMNLVIVTGGNKAAAITAYVFVIIATVLVGLFSGWLFAVGTGYKVKFTQLFKNTFVLLVGTPLQTVLMAGFTLIPVWLFMIGGLIRTISYVLFVFLGFSFILLSWTAYTQWVFDMFVTPNLKAAAQAENSVKTEKQLAQERAEEQRRTAMELLAAGRSELIARPIMPIASEPAVRIPAMTFTRTDITAAASDRAKLTADVTAYEQAHINDPVYAEYNKLFAERERALQSDTGKKGKKAKKISADNLLK